MGFHRHTGNGTLAPWRHCGDLHRQGRRRVVAMVPRTACDTSASRAFGGAMAEFCWVSIQINYIGRCFTHFTRWYGVLLAICWMKFCNILFCCHCLVVWNGGLKKKTVGDVVASRRTACQKNIVGAPVFQKILNRTVWSLDVWSRLVSKVWSKNRMAQVTFCCL